jgi:Protein of unknown function (DUF3617)
MKRIIMAAAGAMLLSGCSGGGDADANGDGEITAKEVAKQAKAEGITPEPGQYKAVITMTGIDIPGMPPEMAGHGAGMTTTTEYCLTKEEVAKGFEEMMKRGQNGECSYEKFAMKDGAFDGVMVCKTPEGEARMTMAGTATPTTSDFTATMAMNFEGAGDGTMKFAAKHERIGDCPAK